GDGGGNKRNPTLLGREDCTLVAWYRFLYAPRTGGRMTVTIGRRKLLAALGGAAAWPLAARAQQPDRMRRIGVLMNRAGSGPTGQSYVRAFAQALRNLGWVEGKNLQIDWRWRAGDADQARKYAAELISFTPDLIFSSSTMNLAALHQVTHTIPIVFVQVSDPV